MTAAILTTIRQQLRKRWVRCVVGLCVLIVGYVESAGSMIGLAFHPRVKSLPFGDQVREATFTFYTPAILISQSRYCPKAVPQFLSWSIGKQRNAVFHHVLKVAQRDFLRNPSRQASSRRPPASLISSPMEPTSGFRGWRGQQLLSFGTKLFKDHQKTLLADRSSITMIKRYGSAVVGTPWKTTDQCRLPVSEGEHPESPRETKEAL